MSETLAPELSSGDLDSSQNTAVGLIHGFDAGSGIVEPPATGKWAARPV